MNKSELIQTLFEIREKVMTHTKVKVTNIVYNDDISKCTDIYLPTELTLDVYYYPNEDLRSAIRYAIDDEVFTLPISFDYEIIE